MAGHAQRSEGTGVTDRKLEERETSREHIIPMSLGGVNGFEIAVDSVFNSHSGVESRWRSGQRVSSLN